MEFVSYDIAGKDFRKAGAASRAIKEHLKRIGADAEAIRRTMIAAYEAEMNVVIHAGGGRLEASLTDAAIDVNVIDEGPGIPDIELAMTEGFSTADAEARSLGFGAGMGLPNIRRNSDRVRVSSRVNEGTRVSFTVYLKPEATCAPCPTSLYASADRCRECRRCLAACPTQALRVRGGQPSVLEHLCVDCAGCIAACESGALTVREDLTSLADLADLGGLTLAVPPALLAGCGPGLEPARVLRGLRSLGFADVVTVAPFEEALRDAVRRKARGSRVGAALPEAAAGAANNGTAEGDALAAAAEAAGAVLPGTGETAAVPTAAGPVISPMCPAVVNLIELRFPSLVPNLAPFDSPWEALQAAYADRPLAFVVSCPGQRSALVTHETAAAAQVEVAGPHITGLDSPLGCVLPRNEYLTPDALREAVMAELARAEAGVATGREAAARPAASVGPEAAAGPVGAARAEAGVPAGEPGAGSLSVTGIDHVIAILEKMEDGLLEDVPVLELWACEGGCFGSPLLREDHHVAALRWSRGKAACDAETAAGRDAAVERGASGETDAAPETDGAATPGAAGAPPAAASTAVAVPRRRPYAARPGVRLDPDMSRAIEKLEQLQALVRSLPGKDCGACGAPTCAALADDIVMERAGLDQCPYAGNEKEEPR